MKPLCAFLCALLFSVSSLRAQVSIVSTAPADTAAVAPADTVALPDTVHHHHASRWELSLGGGLSQFGIPTYAQNTIHTRRNTSEWAGAFSIGYYFRPWLQAGLSASYLKMSYKDDAPYFGSQPNTYNTVYLASPFIPVQLYARAFMGKERGFRSCVSLAAGYAFVSGSYILNSKGQELKVVPETGNAVTVSVGTGLDYFFSRHFGLGGTGAVQRFWMHRPSGTLRGYIYPVTAGLRFRF